MQPVSTNISRGRANAACSKANFQVLPCFLAKPRKRTACAGRHKLVQLTGYRYVGKSHGNAIQTNNDEKHYVR